MGALSSDMWASEAVAVFFRSRIVSAREDVERGSSYALLPSLSKTSCVRTGLSFLLLILVSPPVFLALPFERGTVAGCENVRLESSDPLL